MFCGKIAVSAMVVGVSVMLLGGCSTDRTKMNEINKKIAISEAYPDGAPKMIEVKHGGKWYVVGSEKSAVEVKAGKPLKSFVKSIGAGPAGETVVFEQDKLMMADLLMEQFEAKYPKK